MRIHAGNQRAGISGVIGALLMFAMLFTAGTSYFISVNGTNRLYDQALVNKVSSQQSSLSEKLTVTTKLTGSNHLAYYVNNSGINSNITSTFLFDSSGNLLKCVGTGLPNTCGNSSPTLPITVNAGKGSPLIDTGYTYSSGTVTVKVVTQRGDIFTSQYPLPPKVTSVFGKTGLVTAQSGDYSCGQITNAFCINPSSSQTITYGAAAVQTILKMASSPTADPFVIQNSAGNSVWDIDTTGTLQVGSIPWARLTSFPAACATNYIVQAVGASLTCAPVPAVSICSQVTNAFCTNPLSTQTITYGAAAVQTILKMASSPTADPFVIQNSAGSAVWDISTSGSLTTGSVPWAQLTSYPTACAAGSWVSTLANNPTCTSLINNRVTTTFSTTSASFVNVGGLSFSTAAGSIKYQFEADIILKSSSTSNGPKFAITVPSGATFEACISQPTTTSAFLYGCTTSAATAIASPSASVASDVMVVIIGSVVIPSGTAAGTVQVQVESSSTSYTTTIEINSWIQAQVSSA